MIDIYSHGNSGCDFSDGDYEGLKTMARYYLVCGVPSFASASMVLPYEALDRALKSAKRLVREDSEDCARLCGIRVEGTYFSYEERIDADYEPLNQAGGYDHNFCFANDRKQKKAAKLQSPDGKVTMTVFTDLCGMQVYAGNFLDGVKGKNGAVYNRRNGICFETQGWPNACNMPSFPNTVYTAGEVFESSTSYVFDI